ncbi:MAG: VacJ family lipoprotein [Pseudomonadota bacterium]
MLPNRVVSVVLLITLSAFMLSACAKRPPKSDPIAYAQYKEANDPIEPFNRAVFNVNSKADKYLIRPLAVGYRRYIPRPIRMGVRNFLRNLNTPFTFGNDLLQGEFKRASVSLRRFIANTTAGFGGFVDIAGREGLEFHSEDLGQTFAVWGIGPGPYVMLPLFGPSNVRDAVAQVASGFADPVTQGLDAANIIALQIGRNVLQVVDVRERVLDQLDQLYAQSDDNYVAVRSAYRQNRKFAISNGRFVPPDEDDLFGDETFPDDGFGLPPGN